MPKHSLLAVEPIEIANSKFVDFSEVRKELLYFDY